MDEAAAPRHSAFEDAQGLVAGTLMVTLGVAFAAFVYFGYEHRWMGLGTAVDSVDSEINAGASTTVKYLAGYGIEKSLSIDNIS